MTTVLLISMAAGAAVGAFVGSRLRPRWVVVVCARLDGDGTAKFFGDKVTKFLLRGDRFSNKNPQRFWTEKGARAAAAQFVITEQWSNLMEIESVRVERFKEEGV